LAAASLSSVAECVRMAETLKWISPNNPTVQDAKEICSTHEYDKIIPLVRAITNVQPDKLYHHLGLLWQNGMSFEDILTDFPELTQEDILACLAFAAEKEHKVQYA